MQSIVLTAQQEKGLTDAQMKQAIAASLQDKLPSLKKVLLIPPDFTRMHSYAGKLTAMYYELLSATAHVDILPALGTHDPMTKGEWIAFFGENVPFDRMIAHNWRTDIVKLGEVPQDFVNEVSEGLVNNSIDVEVNRCLMDPSYDLIVSLGQVVPHEVVGMANYSKNIFVGCGGSSMINQSHMLGAFFGMERVMGKDGSPVRKVFDYAEQNYIAHLPMVYVLTVTTNNDHGVSVHGLYIGRERTLFEEAVKLSQQKNLTFTEKPFQKVVVYLDEREFKSTWLGNKAIYRTRMAIADGGELIVLAPGVKKFGEDEENDKLIREYGYVGRKNVLDMCKTCEDLRGNLSVAAHLIHGSSDDRFSITYAVEKLSQKEVEKAGFQYMPLEKALEMYSPETLKDGWNTLDSGEEIYYISNPALGLWALKSKFE